MPQHSHPTLTRWACTADTSRRRATRWSTSSGTASCDAASRAMHASACSCATRAHARSLKRRLGGATAHHPCHLGWAPGSRLQAQGSRLQAPLRTYGTSRRLHPFLLGRAPQALGSWPCHALRTSRSATEGPVGGCGAAMGRGQRRRCCGVPPAGPRLRVQQHALASPQTQAQYLDLGDGTVKV